MIKQKFVGREKALEWLRDQYKRGSSFAVLYGRRRIGKTELVTRFSSNLPHIYFLAGEKPDAQNLKDLQGRMTLYLNDDVFDQINFNSWEGLFTEFMKRVTEKIIITIDEFPYLIEKNRSIPSIFQKIWDENLKNKDIMLILLGSSIGMMETDVLGYRSPLYGRRTGQWKLEPFKFKELKLIYPHYDFEERLRFFSFTDGIPGYTQKTDPGKRAEWNIKNNIFKKGSYLYEEAEVLLRQELREPANYFQILQAIAEGNTRYGEICNRTDLDKSMVSQYLKNLINMHIVNREFPVTQKKESRNAIYRLSDNYYKFWFTFVYPNKSLIEEDKQAILMRLIFEKLRRHESFVFERVCKEMLWDLYPINFNRIGRWWHKDKEIDLVGLNEKTKEILFCECKWQERVNPKKVLENLKEKSVFVDWSKGKRKEYFCIIAKSFSKRIDEENVFLFDLGNLNSA